MGRWAQRRRGGGGGGNNEAGITINNVNFSGTDSADIFFSAEVTAADFSPANFASVFSGGVGIAVTQLAPDELLVQLSLPNGGDAQFVYVGTVPGVISPQVVAYN